MSRREHKHSGVLLTFQILIWVAVPFCKISSSCAQIWTLLAQSVKNLPAMQETQVRFLGQEDPLEKEMAIHSSILAWKPPSTEEPGGLQSMGSQESDTTQRLNHHHHIYIRGMQKIFFCIASWDYTNLRLILILFGTCTHPSNLEPRKIKRLHREKNEKCLL